MSRCRRRWPLVLAGVLARLACRGRCCWWLRCWLLAVSGWYGVHGDEMYYVVAGQHPAFGYVDQPPLTPLLSAASVAVLGVTPTAVRVLPAVEMALVVVPMLEGSLAKGRYGLRESKPEALSERLLDPSRVGRLGEPDSRGSCRAGLRAGRLGLSLRGVPGRPVLIGGSWFRHLLGEVLGGGCRRGPLHRLDAGGRAGLGGV